MPRITRHEAGGAAIGLTLAAIAAELMNALPDMADGALLAMAQRLMSGEFGWVALLIAGVSGAAAGYVRRRLRQQREAAREWPKVSNDGGER